MQYRLPNTIKPLEIIYILKEFNKKNKKKNCYKKKDSLAFPLEYWKSYHQAFRLLSHCSEYSLLGTIGGKEYLEKC